MHKQKTPYMRLNPKLLVFLLLLFPFHPAFSQCSWLLNGRCDGTGQVHDPLLNTSAAGYTYAVINYAAMDLSFGTDTICRSGNDYDNALILKLDSSGNIIWRMQTIDTGLNVAKQMRITSITTDNKENVYIVGYFDGWGIMFDTNYIPKGGTHSFNNVLVKMDSSGKFLWYHTFDAPGFYLASALKTDKYQNVYYSSIFDSTFIIGSDTLLYTGGLQNIFSFLAKFDSSGTPLWAKKMGQDGLTLPVAIALSTHVNDTNVYVAVNFNSAYGIRVAGQYFSCSGGIFLADFDPAGGLNWGKKIGDKIANAYDMAIDSSDNLYLTGALFSDSIHFGSTTIINNNHIINNNNPTTYFLTRINYAGQYQWSRGAYFTCRALKMTTDVQQNILVCGSWEVSPFVCLGNDTFHMPSTGADPVFFLQYDSSGNQLCDNILLSGAENGSALSADRHGNYYLAGAYMMDSFQVCSYSLPWHSYSNCFITKFRSCNSLYHVSDNPNAIHELSSGQLFSLYPNPANDQITIVNCLSKRENINISIFTISGQMIKSVNSLEANSHLDISTIPPGMYFVKVQGANIDKQTIKFVKY